MTDERRRRRHVLVTLGSLPFWACVSAASRAAPAAAPAAGSGTPLLTISTAELPAFNRRALQLVGEEAFRRAGLALRVTIMPSQRALIDANAGEVDGEGLRVVGLEATYPNLVRVPEHLVAVSFVGFTRDPKLVLDQGFASLKPLRVAYINGWKLFEAEAAIARSVNKVDHPEQLFRMLEADRIDVALYTLTDGLALSQSMRLSQVRALQPSLADVQLFLYLHRRHEARAPTIARALRDMKVDGTHARLLSLAAQP